MKANVIIRYSGSGSGTVSKSVEYKSDSRAFIHVNVTPDTGSELVSVDLEWVADCGTTTYSHGGVASGTKRITQEVGVDDPSYTGTCTVTVNFKMVFDPAVLHYNASVGGGSGTVSPTSTRTVKGKPPCDLEFSASASPDVGWRVYRWTVSGDVVKSVDTNSTTYSGNVHADSASYYYASIAVYFERRPYSISVVASPEEGGTVSGGGTFYYGDTAYITAVPSDHYVFDGWSDGVDDLSRSVTVKSDKTYAAKFHKQKFTVVGEPSPEGWGKVTGGGFYSYGTSVTLTAVPSSGKVFLEWDDGDTSPTKTVVIVEDRTYVATFVDEPKYAISVQASPENGGTVSITGGPTYRPGTLITISASPAEGFDFVSWDDGSTDTVRIVTAESDRVYVATFSKRPLRKLSLSVSPEGSGSVSGSGTYYQGSAVTVSAEPSNCMQFVRWSDGSTDQTRTVVMAGDDISLVAYFEKIRYTLTVESSDDSKGTVSGGGTYDCGTVVTVTATPKTGWNFIRWTDGGDQTHSVVVTSDMSIVAHFSEDTVTVRLKYYPAGYDLRGHRRPDGWQTSEHGSVTLNGKKMTRVDTYTFTRGTEISLSAVVVDTTGVYHFSRWWDGVTVPDRTVTLYDDLVVSAHFGCDSLLFDNVASSATALSLICDSTTKKLVYCG